MLRDESALSRQPLSATNWALHVCMRSGCPLKECEIDPRGWVGHLGSQRALPGYAAVLQECLAARQAALQVSQTGLRVVLDHAHPAHCNLHITTAIMTDDKCSMKTAQKLSQLQLDFSWITYTLIATCTHL